MTARFLPFVPKHGHVLDAGCGSGRDSRAFRERGYQISAFDESRALADLASQYCGLPVQVMHFQGLDSSESFDAIWACASLLHVPLTELPSVFSRLFRALRPQGVMFLSFKHGRGEERTSNGRHFTDLDEVELLKLLRDYPTITLLETWVTPDLRTERKTDLWLNALLTKS